MGPDVVFVVVAAVVFTQFLQNPFEAKTRIFHMSKGNGSEFFTQIRQS